MKKLLLGILALTLLDAAATAAGVRLGYLEEVNPLLYGSMNRHPFISSLLICLVTAMLLYLLYKLRTRVNWLKYAMSGVLAIKSAIVCLHIIYALMAWNAGYFAESPFTACYFLP
jgi:hypothetical protein